jgi:BMFP domain-containing protein YqiC
MADRPRLFDDLAGVAGGALSALSGLRDEAEQLVRARVDETIRKLDLVRREELDAMSEMASLARTGQEAAETQVSALEARVAALEDRLVALEDRLSTMNQPITGGGGPGMIV